MNEKLTPGTVIIDHQQRAYLFINEHKIPRLGHVYGEYKLDYNISYTDPGDTKPDSFKAIDAVVTIEGDFGRVYSNHQRRMTVKDGVLIRSATSRIPPVWAEDINLPSGKYKFLFRLQKKEDGSIFIYLRNPKTYFMQMIDAKGVNELIDFLKTAVENHKEDFENIGTPV